MATDNEDVSTTQFPEEIPQTIPDLYLRLKARMDVGFSDMGKELSVLEIRELRQELQNVEHRLNEEIRLRFIDLRQRIERLQGSLNLIDKRFELQDSEIAYLKKSLRELENKIDPPLAA
jgi:hypothetical protein